MQARDDLILSCIPVVTKVAKSFSKHSQASYGDLFQEGMMGVLEAIDKYDYTRNVKFVTLAYTRIIHRLALWVKHEIKHQKVGVKRMSSNGVLMGSTIEAFQSVFHTCPTDSQLSELLSLPTEDISYLRQLYDTDGSGYRMYSLDTNRVAADNAIDASMIVEKAMCDEYNKKHLFDAIKTLGELEREIILRRYLYRGEKAKLEELAREFHVDASTISRRERKALQMILRYFQENNIIPEL